MKWRSLEHFSDDSVAASALPTSYANSKVKTICSKASTLDQNRQKFIATMEDMIAKLKAAESSSSVNDRLNAYKSQLIRLNDLNNYIISITDFFNGDDVTGQNCIQNLVDLSKLLSTSTDQAYITETSQLLTKAEDTMKTVYTLSNKLETIRNYLINFLNITNRNISYARLLCLKGQLLDPTLQSLAIAVNSKLQDFVTALQNWCAQMATIDPQPTCNSSLVPVPTSTVSAIPNIPGSVSKSPSVTPPVVSSLTSTVPSVSTTTPVPSSSETSSRLSTGCPVTAMSYDSGKQEYRITSHPEIKDWGIKNTMWQADGGFVPDYVAQKMGLQNRCENLNDFKITDHKDIKNYVPNAQYKKLKTAAQALQIRAKKCEAAFKQQSCVCPGSKESFENSVDTTTDDDSLACQAADTLSPVNFQINQHKDYRNLLKKYTPNCKLPSVCKTYPIQDNVAIGDYVLKSSLPSTLTKQPLEEHPDFKAYNQTWISKADLQAKTASQNAEKTCSIKLAQFSGTDTCGNTVPYKALGDYRLQDHPDFAQYTREWKDVVSKFANKDANGNLVKCQTPSSIQKEKNELKADCARSLSALKAQYATLSDQSQQKPVSSNQCRTQESKQNNNFDKVRCDLEKSELARSYESKLNKLSAPQPTTLRPDMTKYILRSDVLPCPTKDEIRANIGNYLTSAQMREMCQKAGFSGSQVKKDTCESHFIRPSNGFAEAFADPPPAGTLTAAPSTYRLDPSHDPVVKPYPQPHDKFSGQYDIMLHRDYKYDDPVNGHMPKQECYSTFATMEDGKPRPCKIAEMDIKKHPDFEKTVMQYGAVKDRCGNLQKPPPCPSLKKNECGDWVQDSCSDQSQFEAQLFKEKLKFNALLKRYKTLLDGQKTQSDTRPNPDAVVIDKLHKQLETMQMSIDKLQASKSDVQAIQNVQPKSDAKSNPVELTCRNTTPKKSENRFPASMNTTSRLRRHVNMDDVAPLVDFTSLSTDANHQSKPVYEQPQTSGIARQSETGWAYLKGQLAQ